MPSIVLGDAPPKEGTPLLYHWRWYYHFPSLPLWALILALLILRKANRDPQAWLILIPLAVVLLVWQMPFRMLAASDETTESFGYFIIAGVMAWSIVWLCGDRLATGRRIGVFMRLFLLMLAVGLIYYCSYFGIGEMECATLIGYSLWILVWLAGMMLTGRSCRKRFSRGRFLGWLIVWNGVSAFGWIAAYTVFMAIMMGNVAAHFLVMFVLFAVIGPVLWGGALYLMNLPFLLMAFKSPFYEARLKGMFLFGKECSESNEHHEHEVA